jgi:PAS domain S-box-containing protein
MKWGKDILQHSEIRYQRLFESAKDGILILNFNGHTAKIVDANPFIGELLGYSQAELLGQELWQIGLFQDIEASKAAIRELQEKHCLRCDNLSLRTKVGQRIPVEVVSNLYYEGHQAMIQCNVRKINKRKRAEEAQDTLKDRLTIELADLERLHALSIRLMEQDDLAAVLHEILVASAELLHVDKASVQIYARQNHALRLISTIGFDQDFVDQFRFVDARGNTSCAAALRQGERVIIENLATDPAFTELARVAAPYGIGAAQSTPLFGSDGKLSGMLTTYFDQPHRPSERELRLLDFYAQQAAQRIERAESEEVLHQSEARLAMELAGTQQLQEISTRLIHESESNALYQQILHAAIAIMRSDMGSIQKLDPSQNELHLLAWKGFDPASAASWEWVRLDSNSSCGAALRARQRVIVPDIDGCNFIVGTPALEAYQRTGIYAMQSTPLLSRSGCMLGMISTHWREPHQPTEHDLSLLDVLARQVADLIERAQTEEALREADRRKNEFLAILAHELRNPLAPILNAVQLLRLTEDNGEVIQLVSEIMERQIGQMVRLVDDLLDVSRITRGKIELRRERVELASAVNHAIEATCPLLQNLSHGLTVTLPPQPVYLHGDSARLAQVIGNLLNNACKFTGKGGQIWLTVECEGEQAVIRVRDTGIGIAADQLSHIFELFTQVDTSLERTQSGLGIGLTLVKNLAEMHGGTVEVHSDGRDQGSEFVVRLPLLVETPKLLLPEPTLVKPTVTTGCRILVVDDNRDAAISLATWLELIGNETQIAYDGLAAVEAAAAFKPHVILLDIGLPKINGYDVARRVREQPGGEKMVLVALTGWGQDEDRKKSREAGFNDHMLKPVDHAALTRLLAKAS